MPLRRLAALALLAAATAVPAEPPRQTLAVAAAANLKVAADALTTSFEAEHPGVEVALTLGASGALFAQLQNGAPFDLFLSADRDYPARLVAAGLAAPADERVYAIGRLVAWLPAGSPLPVASEGLAALTRPEARRIAIANPAVAPFGRLAEQALRQAGILDAVKDRLVLGASVGQAAQFASTGAADAALLPRSLTIGTELAAGTIVPLPDDLAPGLEQSAVVLASSRQATLARAFLAFVTGATGRAILARSGYDLP